jgi:hypothetical protein
MTETTHPSEDDLVLHYYGEGETMAAVEAHLEACAACRQRYQTLRSLLFAVTDASLGHADAGDATVVIARAWQALSPRLAVERRQARIRRLMLPLAMAASLVVAFTLGRHTSVPREDPARGSERVLLVAVGDHLERSEMLLLELVNAPADRPFDIGAERTQAEDLLGASRLYRAAATRAGEPGLASVLEEVERLLVEVAHRPEEISSDDLAGLRRRIESRGLLFKVRVLGFQVREKQKERMPGGAVS